MERFWSKVDRGTPDDCWIWTASVSTSGYPTFWGGAEVGRVHSHRFAYELEVGPIPDGLTIDHLCNRPLCVNPAHLEAVTQRVNILRAPNGVAAQNARKTHCKRGHPFDQDNTYVDPNGYRICRTCRRATDRSRARVAP